MKSRPRLFNQLRWLTLPALIGITTLLLYYPGPARQNKPEALSPDLTPGSASEQSLSIEKTPNTYKALGDQQVASVDLRPSPRTVPRAVPPPYKQVLDKQAIEHIDTIAQNTLLPAFSEQDAAEGRLPPTAKTAIDILSSQLPDSLADKDWMMLSGVLSNHLDADATELILSELRLRQTIFLEQKAMLDSVGPPADMTEQLELAMQLEAIEQSIREDYDGINGSADSFNSQPLQTTEPSPDTDQELESGLAVAARNRYPDLEESEAQERYIETELGMAAANNYRELEAIEYDWLEKYQAFQQMRRPILEAGLSQRDKDEQLEQLLKEHYSNSEIQALYAFEALQETPTRQNQPR